MSDESDWLMRPVIEGLCKYESLIDGTLELTDIARMNEAIAVKYENMERRREMDELTRSR